jgi:hypothetical protein
VGGESRGGFIGLSSVSWDFDLGLVHSAHSSSFGFVCPRLEFVDGSFLWRRTRLHAHY